MEILAIQKNGTYFTIPRLRKVTDRCIYARIIFPHFYLSPIRYRSLQTEYREQQQILVDRAVDTAATYVPVLESTAQLIAELDVLAAFATAAALSPSEYSRPAIRPRGDGIISVTGGRHPCVELMDDVQFIANTYDLQRGYTGIILS